MNEDNLKLLSEPSLLTNKFAKAADRPDILDICSGNLDHVNLRQVGQLEAGLSGLFKKVWRLNEALKTGQASGMLPLHRESLKSQVAECLETGQGVCRELFDLALLVPSAPWPVIRKSPICVTSMDRDG
jgi:hypothetical protein